jgi:hypothetical protein
MLNDNERNSANFPTFGILQEIQGRNLKQGEPVNAQEKSLLRRRTEVTTVSRAFIPAANQSPPSQTYNNMTKDHNSGTFATKQQQQHQQISNDFRASKNNNIINNRMENSFFEQDQSGRQHRSSFFD